MIKETKNKKFLVYLALITATLLWGGSFSAMKSVLKTLHPWTVMWFRMVGASIVLLPFIKRILPKKNMRKDLKFLIPMMILQPCLYFLLESNALKYTSSSQAGIISALVPIFVSIGAYLIFSEKIGAIKITGIILSLSGIIVLTLCQSNNSEAINPLLGNTLEILAMVSAAICILLVKKLSSNFNPWTLTALQVFSGIIFFSPGLAIFILNPPSELSFELPLIILFLGAGVTLGAFGLYNWGITKIEVSKASILINLVPLFAFLFGWFFFGELLNKWQIIAGFFVLTGVTISQINRKIS